MSIPASPSTHSATAAPTTGAGRPASVAGPTTTPDVTNRQTCVRDS